MKEVMAREEEQGGNSPEGEALHRGQEQGWLGERGEEAWTAHPAAVRVGFLPECTWSPENWRLPFPTWVSVWLWCSSG